MENQKPSDDVLNERERMKARLELLGEQGVYAYGRLLRTNPRLLAGSMATNIHDLVCIPMARLREALGSRYSHYVNETGQVLPYTTQHAQSVGEPDEAITEDGGLPYHKAYAIGQKFAMFALIDPPLREYFYTPVRNDHVGANEVAGSRPDGAGPLQGVFTVGGVSFMPERKAGRRGPPCWGVRVLGSGMEIHPANGGGTIFKSETKAKMIEDVARTYQLRMKYGQEDANLNHWRACFGLPPIKSPHEQEAVQSNAPRQRAQ